MGEAKDIAGFIIPYSAGIFISVLGAGTFSSIITVSSAIFFTIAAISLIFLISPSGKRLESLQSRVIIAVAGISCGLVCGFTGLIRSYAHIQETGWLTQTAYEFRELIENAIGSLPFKHSHTAAVIKAFLTGNRESMPPEIATSFRNSGASHILALSGLHLGIIYGTLSKSLSILGNSTSSRTARSLIIVGICGFYTIATGAAPSITRAFLFIMLGEAGRITCRKHSIGNVLVSALLIQLCTDPLSAGTAGFQLSYAAMAGIAFIYPHLSELFPYRDTGPVGWVWKSAAMSISCQLTTGPIAYIHFGTFPHYFLITNMIALPLTGIAIPCAVLTIGLDLAGICPDILIKTLEGIIVILTDALEIISNM